MFFIGYSLIYKLSELVLYVFCVSFQTKSYPNEREIQQNVCTELLVVKDKGTFSRITVGNLCWPTPMNLKGYF